MSDTLWRLVHIVTTVLGGCLCKSCQHLKTLPRRFPSNLPNDPKGMAPSAVHHFFNQSSKPPFDLCSSCLQDSSSHSSTNECRMMGHLHRESQPTPCDKKGQNGLAPARDSAPLVNFPWSIPDLRCFSYLGQLEAVRHCRPKW